MYSSRYAERVVLSRSCFALPRGMVALRRRSFPMIRAAKLGHPCDLRGYHRGRRRGWAASATTGGMTWNTRMSGGRGVSGSLDCAMCCRKVGSVDRFGISSSGTGRPRTRQANQVTRSADQAEQGDPASPGSPTAPATFLHLPCRCHLPCHRHAHPFRRTGLPQRRAVRSGSRCAPNAAYLPLNDRIFMWIVLCQAAGIDVVGMTA